jgi:hypothetical protein
MIKFYLLCVLFLCILNTIYAQQTYILNGYKESWIANRLEIKLQKHAKLNFSGIQPYNRQWFTEALIHADTTKNKNKDCECITFPTSSVDDYNMAEQLQQNRQFAGNYVTPQLSKRPLGQLYATPQHLFEVNDKDFYLVVNPIIHQMQGVEFGSKRRPFINAKGVEIRGDVSKKVGFAATIVDIQERGAQYVRNFTDTFSAFPGAGFKKVFKVDGVDYFDATGYVTFSAAKRFNFQLGYDRNHFGNGIRSLILSEFAPNYYFLKMNLNVWKLNYQVMWMQLNQTNIRVQDGLLPKKYAAFHHLSINAAPWLNVGVFENIVFSRSNNFEISYLNPLIFYRSVEQQNGSPDNAVLGFDLKANIAKRGQFYAQFTLDEFNLAESRNYNKWWGNKYGMQLGGKLIDAFDVPNLDLQAELNVVRPFTYSHYDSSANYAHYNQPLAHPLGANFKEFIFLARYQPKPKWYAEAKLVAWQQGLDSNGINYGNNIFKLYTTRPFEDNWTIGKGIKTNGLLANFWLGYEIKQNLFIDANLLYRRYSNKANIGVKNTTQFSLGIRINMRRRDLDF